MILYIMLVALGFLIATLLALLVAPLFWRRAERLTTRRLEQSMPMSIAETEADRDQLRASYAIVIRRLEAALSQEKMRCARQLVQISRLQMEIANLNDQTAQLRGQLEAEHNAASVLRRTIATRVPELNRAASDAKQLVHIRDREIDSIVNRLRHREEALAIAQRTTEMQQAEIARLRQAMEMSGAQNAGRFKLRPTQWTIHDYRAEYDRLNVELSKLRERLSVAYDREANQITQVRTELQQLADQIVTTASGISDGADKPAITQEQPGASSTPRLNPPSADTDAQMRSIDAIITGEGKRAQRPTPVSLTRHGADPARHQPQRRSPLSRAALSSTRLARSAVAKVTGLAGGGARSVDARSADSESRAGATKAPAAMPGRLSAAKLLGGAAVSDSLPKVRLNEDKTSPETQGAKAASTGPAMDDILRAPESGEQGSQSAGQEQNAETPERQTEQASGAPATPPHSGTTGNSSEPDGTSAKSSSDDGSLYDRFRSAKPASGKLMSENGPLPSAADTEETGQSVAADTGEEPSAEPSSDVSGASAEDPPSGAGSNSGDGEADSTGDAEETPSGSSLLDRLKQVPENQSR